MQYIDNIVANTNLLDASEPFAMPIIEAQTLTRALRAAGLEFEYVSWRDVMRGEASLSYDEALDALRPFESEGIFTPAPCLIVSRVPREALLDMLAYLLSDYNPDHVVADAFHSRSIKKTVKKPEPMKASRRNGRPKKNAKLRPMGLWKDPPSRPSMSVSAWRARAALRCFVQ